MKVIIKVSIVIPVYNVEAYLEECMESAVNQTLDNIEIICINDGSTDSSLEILKKYEKKYNNIIIINQENKGLSASRNVGIRNARGKYIYFLDSDDFIDIESMEICYKVCENSKLDMVTFDAKCFLDKNYTGLDINENYDRKGILPETILSGKDFYILSIERGVYRAPVWLNFYKTEFIKNNNLYFVEGIYHEDEIHTCESLLKAKRIKHISYKFFHRRFRNNSIMTSGINKNHVEGNFEVAKQLCKFYRMYKNDKDPKLGYILYKCTNSHIRSTLSRCDSIKDIKLRRELIDFSKKNRDIIEILTDIHLNSLALYYGMR